MAPRTVKESPETKALRSILNDRNLDTEERLLAYDELQLSKIANRRKKKELLGETGKALEDFLPYQIIFEPAIMFKDMGVKELKMLEALLSEIDRGDQSNERIRPAYHAIAEAMGVLKNLSN